MKLASYWHDTAPRFAGADPGPVEGRVDVAVVGGGFTGLSAALALARRGASVAVLEASHVGAGASGRNGGQCNNGFAQDFGAMEARFGFDGAVALYRAFDAAVDTVERLVREEGIDCAFARTGKLKLAAKPAHAEKLLRARDALHRGADPDVAFVPREALAPEIGSARYHGGLVYPKSASLHMGRFVSGLATAAVRAGARIHEGAAVRRLDRIGRGEAHDIETARGRLRADQVLLATGPSMAGPFFRYRRRIVPIGSFIVVTEPLSRARVDAIMPRRRMCTTTQNIGHYFRITPDDRLLFGGRARFALSSATSDAKSGRILAAGMLDTFPELAGTRLDWCWGGIVDMTQDRLPRAGQHDGLYYSLGYSGHGTQMSTHMGQVMASVMAGDSDANPWSGLDWPAIRGHFGPPWFLPLVGAYYKLQDWLH